MVMTEFTTKNGKFIISTQTLFMLTTMRRALKYSKPTPVLQLGTVQYLRRYPDKFCGREN